MKKRKIIIFFIIILLIITSLVTYFMLPNKLYQKYKKQDNYKCNNNICEVNNQTLNEKYIYSNKIDTKQKMYQFTVKNKEKTIEYTANYQDNKNVIIITYLFDEIEWKGNYYIDSNYISLKLNCEECDINEEEIQEYRNQAYIESTNITNDILKIIKS